jgi:hypothetical protein
MLNAILESQGGLMRQILVMGLVLMTATASLAVTRDEVAYLGGTSSVVKAGDVGTLDTAPATDLIFSTSNGRLAIAYASLQRVEYRNEVAYHLGVAPAIVVGLLKKRERKHLFTLTYSDKDGVKQVASFEVSKDLAPTLLTVLSARAPKACIAAESYHACSANTVTVTQRWRP